MGGEVDADRSVPDVGLDGLHVRDRGVEQLPDQCVRGELRLERHLVAFRLVALLLYTLRAVAAALDAHAVLLGRGSGVVGAKLSGAATKACPPSDSLWTPALPSW
jgi:hypothetical protein